MSYNRPHIQFGAHLYVPADQPRLLESARRRDVSAVIFDLEDSVAPDRKDLALTAVLEELLGSSHRGQLWIRLNSGARALAEVTRIAAAQPAELRGVWVPKAERSQQVDLIADVLPQTMLIGVIVESATGLFALPRLLAHPRVNAVQLGEVDLSADLGIDTTDAAAMDPYRALVVASAAAARVAPPIGPVSDRLDDMSEFARTSKQLAARGFAGRGCLNPAQADIAERTFRPSLQEVTAARQLIQEYQRALVQGTGVLRTDGVMIDEASVRQAKATLAKLGVPEEGGPDFGTSGRG
ncbi:HpcH/HpaI aldolase/citrate lyase family protein [Nocardia sp. NPDC050630]|uniref:HpcH/HpaI aldolase/citrate lyase family protein n=1 Tax=Nocardia sp. NPDC050630 TaxID=3364321 RepID=UPI0037964D9D